MLSFLRASTYICLIGFGGAQPPSWSSLNDDARPPPVEAFGSALAESSLWRFGGLGIDRGSTVIRSDLWKLPLNASRWLPVPVTGSSPPARTRTCMVAWPNLSTGSTQLIIAAGRFAISSQPDSTYRDFNDVWSFDTSLSSWTQLSPGGSGSQFPPVRSGHGCGIRGDSLLLFGGSTWQGGLLADTWEFHIPTAEWRTIQTTGMGPPPSFAINTAYIPPVPLPSSATGFRGDALIVQGGRTASTFALSPLSTVLSETYILVLGPDGRPDSNGSSPSSGPAAMTSGTWYPLPTSSQVRAGAPPRAFAAPFLAVRNGSIAFCLHGGAESVAFGDRLTTDVLCVDVTSALDWARRLNSGQAMNNGRALQAQASAQIIWYVLSVSGRNSLPVSRQRAAAYLLPPASAAASALPTLMVHAGSSMDTILADTWSISIPALPAPGTAAAPWSVYTPPAPGYDWITVQWVALSGFGLLVLFTMVLLLIRKLNERYRLRALERSIAADHARELALMHALDSMGWRSRPWDDLTSGQAGGLARVHAEGGAVRQGLPQQIIEQLPTFTYSRDKSCSENTACPVINSGRGDAEGEGTGATPMIPSVRAVTPAVGQAFDADSQTGCMICLSEFQEGEQVTVLPCLHRFHGKPCVTAWLLGHRTCPLCKLDVAAAVIS